MLLDTSVDVQRTLEDTAEQRLEKILTVPEYSSEIYAYLREAEVNFFSHFCNEHPAIILFVWLHIL